MMLGNKVRLRYDGEEYEAHESFGLIETSWQDGPRSVKGYVPNGYYVLTDKWAILLSPHKVELI